LLAIHCSIANVADNTLDLMFGFLLSLQTEITIDRFLNKAINYGAGPDLRETARYMWGRRELLRAFCLDFLIFF
jgi:hypothetical protein